MQNIIEAKKALVEKPVFATSAERVLILNEIKAEYKEMPQPLRFAKFLSVLLSRVSVPIEDFDLIAGRCVDRELTPEEEEIFKQYIKSPDNPKHSAILNSGHCTFSWDNLVKLGISGLIDTANTRLSNESDSDKRVFLSAIIEVYKTIQSYILRYSETAKVMGFTEVSDNLDKIAFNAPDSFYSALQLLWIVTLINCAYVSSNSTLTVGRLDKILYPLYKNDIENGILTREKAKEYITDYYCKHNLIMGRGEHQVGDETNSTTFDRIFCFDAPQYLLLAGTDENGNYVVNELTQLFAECICPDFKNPVIVLRYFNNLDTLYPKLWSTVCEKQLKSASIIVYNDDNIVNTYNRIGLPIEDSRNYEHFGCNWPSTGENGSWMNIGPKSKCFNVYESDAEKAYLSRPFMRYNTECGWPEDFMIILQELAGKENVTIEDFYKRFFERMGDFIDRKLEYLSKELKARRRRPSAVLTFRDCFLRESVENAECAAASSKYHFELQSFYMFGTVADCFITVDKLVFIDKKVTLKQLLDAVESNFEGYPDILALCRYTNKYGSDTPHSNYHAMRLSKTASDLVIEKNKPYFNKYKLFLEPCIQSDTWHLKNGLKFGATPDGRLKSEPFSQNIRPSNGAVSGGITALLNSVLNLPTDGLLSGALNLDIDPNQFKGENGGKLFSVILGTYFNRGGLCAQVSAADVNELIDAQINPHLHRDLRVRVTGYSGIYVDICKSLQDDIIERFK